MSFPKISVVMPVYNTKGEYLYSAIESILNQTFSDIELIIVNDGSTDSVIEKIIKSYSDPRIKYFYQDNGGAASARNLGISKAKGKYIAFMDSDDISLPDRLQKQYDFLEKHEKIGCLGTKAQIIGDKTCKKMHSPEPVDHDSIQAHLLCEGCVFCQSSVMLRKCILDKYKISYRDEYVPAEDYALWLDLVGYTNFKILEETLVVYRFHKENISNREKEEQHNRCICALVNSWKRFLQIEELDTKLWQKFYTYHPLTNEENVKLSNQLKSVMDGFMKKGYSKNDVTYFFKKRFKKCYYKTKTFSGQLALWKSPWNKIFRLPLSFRLFCLITRGIL